MPRKHLIAAAATLLLAGGALVGWANLPDGPPLPAGAVADRVVVDIAGEGDASPGCYLPVLPRVLRPVHAPRPDLPPHRVP